MRPEHIISFDTQKMTEKEKTQAQQCKYGKENLIHVMALYKNRAELCAIFGNAKVKKYF